ncbi:hypothetical protein HQ545_01895 [Candidatus Woesearchaeota archaeon]|nr:hypothetical protein [Candidatus Woesearchaeota archaeon]
MKVTFPCGATGKPEFCPSLCNYGQFCKVKENKTEPIEETSEPEQKEDKEPNVEIYY